MYCFKTSPRKVIQNCCVPFHSESFSSFNEKDVPVNMASNVKCPHCSAFCWISCIQTTELLKRFGFSEVRFTLRIFSVSYTEVQENAKWIVTV